MKKKLASKNERKINLTGLTVSDILNSVTVDRWVEHFRLDTNQCTSVIVPTTVLDSIQLNTIDAPIQMHAGPYEYTLTNKLKAKSTCRFLRK